MDTAVTAQKKWWSGGHSPFNVSYGKLMMWYFLMSDAFTFGALLISYGTIRFMSTSWPDPNEVFHSFPFVSHTAHLPLVFVSLMTFILIMSSVTMVLAVHAGHQRKREDVIKWMIWTIIGGAAFLSCQAWEWMHLHELGAWWGQNPFPNEDGTVATTNFTNFFFTITGFHGLHVTSGVILNIVILANVVKGTYEDRGHYEMIEKVGLYWHFVDLVWVFVFTCFYLL